MREIILDTETTGLNPGDGHRVVEIGAIELLNHIPSGRTFHAYLDPQRDMPPEATVVHGLTGDFLLGKPPFAAVVQDFLDFIKDARLVIHNAAFDTAFLNAELALAGHPPIGLDIVVDTLLIARGKHPMGPNSLDALCKRYGIDNSRRERHGALLDAELLADVYIELIGGRQAALVLSAEPRDGRGAVLGGLLRIGARPRPLPPRLTEAELTAHARHVAELGRDALWKTG